MPWCETRTEGTVNFCFNGTGTGMHDDCCSSIRGSGAGFGSGSNIKWKEVKKSPTYERPTFLEIMLRLTLKRQGKISLKLFVVVKMCYKIQNCLIPNRSRNFSKVGTGTVINHYCSTKLFRWIPDLFSANLFPFPQADDSHSCFCSGLVVLLLGLVGLATSCARSFALSYSFAFILLCAIILQGILAILLVFFRFPNCSCNFLFNEQKHHIQSRGN